MRKTLSFACLHFLVAFLVGWALSGDWRIGGALALVEPLCNTVAFHFHEKVWKRIEARRARTAAAARYGARASASAAWSICLAWASVSGRP